MKTSQETSLRSREKARRPSRCRTWRVGSAITLLGSPAELAEIFLQYKCIRVSQFIISGWLTIDEMVIFGREAPPLVRRAESH